MLLESYKHADSCFITLTYNEENEPENRSLKPEHLKLWLKRIRQHCAPTKLRFYAVGEYGDENARPHYHVALFGLDSHSAGGDDGVSGLVGSTWPYGFVYVGELTPESAQYVCGYVIKKMTKKEDFPDGRHPEFARMSLRPGIGRKAMEDVARVLQRDVASGILARDGDVPLSLKHGMRDMPLGRYLRSKLREDLGLPKETPEQVKKAYALQMHAVLKDALSNPENTSKSAGKILVDMGEQKRRNQAAKFKIHAQKRNLNK